MMFLEETIIIIIHPHRAVGRIGPLGRNYMEKKLYFELIHQRI